jgi:hypothetical protein
LLCEQADAELSRVILSPARVKAKAGRVTTVSTSKNSSRRNVVLPRRRRSITTKNGRPGEVRTTKNEIADVRKD